MEAARTSETSVDIKLRTRQYIPEDSELHTRHLENLKSHNRYTVEILVRMLAELVLPGSNEQFVCRPRVLCMVQYS
jgi:hypothetical protein